MQNQTLKCTDARHLVHLAVGDDTLPEEEQQLAEHLHTCDQCRGYHADTVSAMQALERVRDDDSVDIPSGSVWSAISDTVKSRRRTPIAPERRRFNGAVAALCACSLTLALVTVVQNLPMNAESPEAVYAPAMSVSMQPGQRTTQQRPQLVPVQQKDGTVVWVDPETGNAYVPDLLTSMSDSPDVTF